MAGPLYDPSIGPLVLAALIFLAPAVSEDDFKYFVNSTVDIIGHSTNYNSTVNDIKRFFYREMPLHGLRKEEIDAAFNEVIDMFPDAFPLRTAALLELEARRRELTKRRSELETRGREDVKSVPPPRRSRTASTTKSTLIRNANGTITVVRSPRAENTRPSPRPSPPVSPEERRRQLQLDEVKAQEHRSHEDERAAQVIEEQRIAQLIEEEYMEKLIEDNEHFQAQDLRSFLKNNITWARVHSHEKSVGPESTSELVDLVDDQRAMDTWYARLAYDAELHKERIDLYIDNLAVYADEGDYAELYEDVLNAALDLARDYPSGGESRSLLAATVAEIAGRLGQPISVNTIIDAFDSLPLSPYRDSTRESGRYNSRWNISGAYNEGKALASRV